MRKELSQVDESLLSKQKYVFRYICDISLLFHMLVLGKVNWLNVCVNFHSTVCFLYSLKKKKLAGGLFNFETCYS